MIEIDDFTEGYLVCLLWQATDFDGDQLVEDHHDLTVLSDEFVLAAKEQCVEFQKDNAGLLEQYYDAGRSEADAGHDFVLTRNRHGAGFWDRGLGGLGDALSQNCHPYGNVDVYLDDSGEFHYCG